jgi:predicted permease
VNALFDALAGDVKLALRLPRKAPGFALTAIAVLALGIGANTAIFSVVNAVLLKPLDYPDPDRIVQFRLALGPGSSGVGGSPAEFNIWHDQTSVFEEVTAYRGGTVNLTGGEFPEQIPEERISVEGFRLFGAPIAHGRGFTAEEDRPGGPRVAILSDSLWRRRFAADPSILGKPISLGGESYSVIGIMAPGFGFDTEPPPEIWTPMQIDPLSVDQAHTFVAAARLKPGVTLPIANAQLQLAYAEFHRRYPKYGGPGDGFTVMSLRDSFVNDVRSSLLLLAGAVSLVLLIACANAANLLLIRAAGRRREIAIRAALGASRGNILRQLLVEASVLSLAGGALGLALGLGGVRALLAIHPGDIPRIGANGAAVTMDYRVALFTLAISLATALLFGLMPAWQASRGDLNAPLKTESGRTGGSVHQSRSRGLLVVSETALAVVLLIGSALLIRSFLALRNVDPGFNPHRVLTLRMSVAGTRYTDTAAVTRLLRDTTREIAALPGVAGVAVTPSLPLQNFSGLPFDSVTHPLPTGSVRVGFSMVSAGYFDLFQIPLRRGRAFTDRDDRSAPLVVIINEAMARQYWPGRDPVGDQILIGHGYSPEFEEPAREIVAVASDVHDQGLNLHPGPMLYVPLAQLTDGATKVITRIVPLIWAVRTQPEPYSLRTAIENKLRQTSGGLPVASIRTMDEISTQSTSGADFDMRLMSVFGGSALLLAAIGIYGLMAYSVQQRTREIGIRMALGAQSGEVRTMVVSQGMRLALTGAAIGILAAFGLTRLLQGFLFGVTPRDPLVFVIAPLILSGIALAAAWIPALRATRIDPVTALRD